MNQLDLDCNPGKFRSELSEICEFTRNRLTNAFFGGAQCYAWFVNISVVKISMQALVYDMLMVHGFGYNAYSSLLPVYASLISVIT